MENGQGGYVFKALKNLPDMSPDEIFGVLLPFEARWRDRQQFLETRGYMLRPRYHPGWTPSWFGTGKHPIFFEDSITLPLTDHLIDATRICDGAPVYIKRVKTGDNESQIATMFSAPRLRTDPNNHCVPILEVFQDADDKTISYMVMPCLRFIDRPPFERVIDVVDFVDQLLEGLVFMHQNGVAHRDCAYNNIMMDASMLYPHGFHPIRGLRLPDGITFNKPLSRAGKPIKYYYVDFGISVYCPQDVHPKLVVGVDGRDRDVPELSPDVPYDPFKVDIFIIGNLLIHRFYETYSNINFLHPLLEWMTEIDPAARPDALKALELWKAIRSEVGSIQRRRRLWFRDEWWLISVVVEIASLITGVINMCRRALR
ncbi:hypothetical protein BKA93DRAFT_772601 [Sparassis latifolia]